MSPLWLASTIADPQHVSRGVVPIAGRRVYTCKGLLVAKEQGFMRSVNIGLAQGWGCV